MEWTKYVLSLVFGGCLLMLFGRKEDGRDKWLLGLGAGSCLAAMEDRKSTRLNSSHIH